MRDFSKGIMGALLAAMLLWGSAVIAHPSQASGSSHLHTNTSASACAYQCSALGHGSSAYDPITDCYGDCTCWG